MFSAEHPIAHASRLLRQAAADFKDGVSLGGVPDWANEPETKEAYDDHIAAAASLEAFVPDQWRPIDSAPKSSADGSHVDGVYLLGFCPDPDASNLHSCICIVWWEPLMRGGRGIWYGEGGHEVHPTHWMPLPVVPSSQEVSHV